MERSQIRGMRSASGIWRPKHVPDEEVPPGWFIHVNRGVCEKELFCRPETSVPSLLLFREGGHGRPALSLVEGSTSCWFYLWHAVSKIERPNVLQHTLDTLKERVEQLTLVRS